MELVVEGKTVVIGRERLLLNANSGGEKHFFGRFQENPILCIVSGYHSHTEAEVTVAWEQVHHGTRDHRVT